MISHRKEEKKNQTRTTLFVRADGLWQPYHALPWTPKIHDTKFGANQTKTVDFYNEQTDRHTRTHTHTHTHTHTQTDKQIVADDGTLTLSHSTVHATVNATDKR